jgi:hypothetical protein
MNTALQFDPDTHQLVGPAGTLPIPDTDQLATRFLMLVEGQCLDDNVVTIAQKYGYCRQRYYQILHAFKQGGLPALQPQKTGPKSNYRRTDQAVRQVLRHRFLHPEASPEVIVQKLRQTHFSISLRSVQRVIADYGLQKKTLRPQPPKPAPASAHPTRRKTNPRATSRLPERRTRGPATPGR